MSFALAEHDRMIANLLIECHVVAVDTTVAPPVCRVTDGSEWVSGWVRWHALAAGAARHWRAPSIGELGMLISPSGDPAQGTFVPGVYGVTHPAPDVREHIEVWSFPDGGALEYDWEAKRYSIALPTGTVLISVGSTSAQVTDSAVTVIAGDIGLKGNTTIDGPLTVTGDATFAAGAAIAGETTVGGKLQVTGDILGGGKIIDTLGNTPNHKH